MRHQSVVGPWGSETVRRVLARPTARLLARTRSRWVQAQGSLPRVHSALCQCEQARRNDPTRIEWPIGFLREGVRAACGKGRSRFGGMSAQLVGQNIHMWFREHVPVAARKMEWTPNAPRKFVAQSRSRGVVGIKIFGT